jgi:hypothetical protein
VSAKEDITDDMANKFSEKLLSDIEDFLSVTGMGPSYFGKQAAKNSELVKRLREGKPIQSDTEQRVRDFMRANRSKARQSEAAQ